MTAIAFVLLAAGIVRRRAVLLAAALLVALITLSFKVQGVLVVGLTLAGVAGAGLARALGKTWPALAAPLAGGLAGMVAALSLSAWVVHNLDTIRSWYGPLPGYAEILLEINYAGEDYIATGPDPRSEALGAQVYVSPSGRERIYARNDGTLWGIAASAVARAPYVLHEMTFGYTRSCFPYREVCYVYRPALQIVMFLLVAAAAGRVFVGRPRDIGLAVLLSCLAGYFLLFLGVSLVMMRYLLPFETISIVVTALLPAYWPRARAPDRVASQVVGA